MELLDDIFSEPSAVKVRAKFQPKAKPRPKKGQSSTGPTHAAIASKEQPISSALANSDSSQLIQPNDSNKNLDLLNSSFAETAGTERTSLGREASNLENVLLDGNSPAEVRDAVSSAFTGHPEIAISKANGDGHLSAGTSLGSQGPEDIIDQLAPADKLTLDASTTQPEDGTSGFPNAGDFQIDIEQETVDFSFLEDVDIMSEAVAPSRNRTVKFRPKPKTQSSRQIDSAEVVSHLSDAGEVPSENQNINEDGLIHANDLDDVNYEIQFDTSLPAEALSEPATNSDENNDDYHLEEETSMKKRLRNSKEVLSENDEPSKQTRMEAEALEESNKKPRKKFPHATRRKRYVNKSLLEAQEGEIDLQTVPIRDLIVLADYPERQAKKQGAEVQPSSTNERSENSLQEDPPYEEDERYGSDQDTCSLDNPSTSRVIKDTGYFNYQSFTGRKQKRWSRHETELFYQGVQEFGPDFTMIQQRYFPDRSRHQVKLKYKKEEREYPMRIGDALTSRAKDLSHFEALIQKLQEQEQATRAKDEETDDENLIGLRGKEDEGREGETRETHATSRKTGKPEANEGSAALSQDPDDTTRVESPVKSYDSEDEFDWNEYKSEL